MAINKEYEKYMDFCNKYKNDIEHTRDIVRNFLNDIPKDATLYVMDNTIKDTVNNLNIIYNWIKETMSLSEEDFDYE